MSDTYGNGLVDQCRNIPYESVKSTTYHTWCGNELAQGWGRRTTANTNRHASKTIFTRRMPKTPQAYVSQVLRHNCPHCYGRFQAAMSCRSQHDNCTCWRVANKVTLLLWLILQICYLQVMVLQALDMLTSESGASMHKSCIVLTETKNIMIRPETYHPESDSFFNTIT